MFTRRQFLRRTGLAGTALTFSPLIVPGSVLGANGTVAPSNRITVGFIGTGRQCFYANIPGFLREADAQCAAVCDVDSWRMAEAQKQIDTYYAKRNNTGAHRSCSAVKDWRELIARKDIDAVMISTPDHWHVLMAVAALEAGKDVCCEKPLTRNIAEGRLLSDTVKRTGRVFRTDSEFRTLKAFHRAAQWARNGKIGKLKQIIAGTPKDPTLAPQREMPVPPELDYDLWLGPAPARPYTVQRVHPRNDLKGRPGWLCIRDYADGMLANWGAHLLDIAMWAADTEHTGPVEVHASGKFPPAENLWNIIQEFEAHFTYASGLELTCKTENPYLRLEGTDGWISIKYPNTLEVSPESLLEWQPSVNDVQLLYKTSEKRDFLDAVKSRQQPMYDAEGGHRTASLSHLALASIATGRKLKWDPIAEKVIDDATANQLLQPKPMRAPWKLET